MSANIRKDKDSYEEISHNIEKKIKPSEFDSSMSYSMSTGNWGMRNQVAKSGITQTLNRLSYLSALSSFRRVISPIEKSGKLPDPRKLHNTQFYYFCPAETPEGINVGIVKNIAMTATITIPTSVEPVMAALDELQMTPIEFVNPEDVYYTSRVFVNGDWVGLHSDPGKLAVALLDMRRKGLLNIYTGISFATEEGTIYINTDGGRLTRPIYIVNDNKLEITNKIAEQLRIGELNWNDLLCEHDKHRCVVEYIDIDESDTCMYASDIRNLKMNKRTNRTFLTYTHLEIHPSLMFGVVDATIPYPDHSQAPRNLYAGAMGKQGMGIPITSYQRRLDTIINVLHYPQMPIAVTKPSKYVHSNDTPAGQNVIVAVACYTGYNQEDSLIMNKSSIERGMFISDSYRTYKDEVKKNQSSVNEEQFMRPEKFRKDGSLLTRSMKPGSYDKLDDDGFVKVGTRVEKGDIIIGKVMPLKMLRKDDPKYKDSSTGYRSKEPGIVDWVYSDKKNVDNYRFAKVRVRSERVPMIGDKFASRCGQKGTVGMTYAQHDMPYSKDGLVPDIIMSPHAFPKRMTMNQPIESVLNKIGVMLGVQVDVTPFNNMDINNIADVLQNQCGLSRTGKEILYNGKTGRMIEAEIFIGPTYYQRLKHMVSDKIHCLTMDHEVLTDSGWKQFDDITMEDKIATLKNDRLVYDHPTELIYYPEYKGKIYHVKGSRIDLAVTSNHRMYVKMEGETEFKLRKIEDILEEKCQYKKNAKYDGCVKISEEELAKLAKQLETEWIWGLNEQQCKALIEEHLLDYCRVYHTSSCELADIFTRLCLHAGWSPYLPADYVDVVDDTYGLVNQPVINHKTDVKIVDYSGPVFCLQVPSEVFYVRRNGLPVWTGNSRALGPKQLLTQQPTEGKSRDGGLRLGEMERDSLISHGTVSLLKERMFDSSDRYVFFICRGCNLIAIANPNKNIFKCNYCKESHGFAKVQVPYATKLFIQEQMALGITPRLKI